MIPNAHFHKDWDTYVKTWFNQPARKERRRKARGLKAAKVAPRPVKSLRPIVRCPTFKYNIKDRAGRGFTLEELKGAGLTKNMVRLVCVCYDIRADLHLNHTVLVEKFSEQLKMYLGTVEMRLKLQKSEKPGNKT